MRPPNLSAGRPAVCRGGAPTTGGPLWPTTYLKGTAIVLDPAGAVFSQIGAGNLRAYVQGTDDVGHAATGN